MESESNIPRAPTPIPMMQFNENTKKDQNETNHNLTALNLSWCFGYNKNIGIQNLCINESKKLFFASSHIGVVNDFASNEQKLLQGHRNFISCCAVSEDKRWLVTADAGNDSTIIVWDLNSYVPVQTYFNSHLEGTLSVAITPDSKYLASISAQYPQVLAVWEWTTDSEVPICTAELDPEYGPQSNIRFNLENTFQIVTNSYSQTIFYEWSFDQGFVYYAPVLNDTTFNKPVGRLTQSIFQLNSSRALSATSLGNIVVWETADTKGASKANKKAFKLFKFQDKAINVLKLMNEFIVIGDSEGHVKFVDQQLHILMWFKHFNLGPINSLSFSQTTKDFKPTIDFSVVDNDATIEYEKFVCKDFIIGATTGVVGHITQSGSKIDIISKASDNSVIALDTHPSLTRICFGNSTGYLQLWDYETKIMLCSRNFNRSLQITCIKFNPKGDLIAIGFHNGQMQIIDSISLDDCLNSPFIYSKDSITHIEFSEDSSFLATAEADFTVSVYKYNFMSDRDNMKIASEPYTFLGRYRAHYKEIVSLMFGIYPDNGEIRLFSLGKDRVLVEYDLINSNYDDLLIKEKTKIEQYAVPLAMAWHPPTSTESFVVTINNEWKYKIYNSITKMCRKTLLGPTFGSFLKKIAILPTQGQLTENRYMIYITEDKLGLQKFPLTGNPFDSVAIFSHPDGVANFKSSYDGKYLFTAGGENNNLFMWNINLKALEAQSVLGGADLKPFYGLIEGGREGEFFKEMRELFYYSQLRHHGLNENTQRAIKLTIPLSEIPFVMRGLGFYPTEQELQTHGEHMTDYELADCISNLLHLNKDVEDFTKEEISSLIDRNFPEELSVDKFMSDILGVPADDFDQILNTWERIKQANTPRVKSFTD
ncbi:WD repeat-containing 66 [Brachionus plicatilis]|uniref:Cilia- and flagella-associated protein 251 n=1 Tax=Brachionus plicatilis TaxID=10195 RepID=A0A3M7QUC6_BRAPC|nr:WD repeat-containing 66 [Brachionus plicatilis]